MNKRNWLVLLLVGVFAITSLNSCKKDEEGTDTTDNGPTEWTRASVFTGDPRTNAATFTLDKVAYLVGGYIRTGNTLNDNYAFNGTEWTQKADFTGSARHSAVGFAVGGKGYVGLGYDGEKALKDFYQYDPAANTWTKKADFPGEARFGAVAFTIGDYAYVGLGATPTDKTFSDFYRYNPTTDTWTAITTKFTYKKAYAFAFVINNVAYVGGGTSNNAYPEEFFSFDGTEWKKLGDLKTDDIDVRRANTSAFAIGSNGYVVSGRSASGVVTSVWKYTPSDDSWTSKHQALSIAREKAIGFAIDGKGYVATGISASTYLDDNWQFVPVR
ncbi:Kelch repeat-containing protein [Sphingobacterium hotanense]|uniref:Kelch repeat-containing protein n=1 Tax=Sphingobacterium hotanense TaxID=649196 RepID=UPI0021A7FC14|nr:kelch repeat-containing protein [Sphingobacterium hotanense]MCT1526005.1 hypothetical protein [Sphingobacterium hotanense]